MEKEKRDEEERAKKKKEKLERILNPPRHRLNDSSYVNEIKENADKVSDALRQGKFKRVFLKYFIHCSHIIVYTVSTKGLVFKEIEN